MVELTASSAIERDGRRGTILPQQQQLQQQHQRYQNNQNYDGQHILPRPLR